MVSCEYYTYVYLDPRKPGNYVYGEYNFEYEPIYVGKGTRRRMWMHLKTRLKRNNLFYSKLNKIIESGYEPIFYKIIDNINEDESLFYEKELIKLIGRIDIENGILCNMTEGGDNGFTRSVEARRKLSMGKMGDKNPMFGKTTSEEQKESVRLAHKNGKINLTEEGREKLSINGKKRKGNKNNKIRKDVKVFELISPKNNKFVINGSVRLQKFCSENKLQYHVLKNNIDKKIDIYDIIGNRIHAINTLNWKLKIKKNDRKRI